MSCGVSAIIPLLWLMFICSLVWPPAGDAHRTALLALSGLIGGNAVLTLLATVGPSRRGWRNLAPYGLTVTAYWALISFAAWRGLYQLIVNPFHWEKTAHGLSRRRSH